MGMRMEQQLSIEFCDFMPIINKLFGQLQKGEICARLVLDNMRETAILFFIQESTFRDVELLQMNFTESDVETIKNSISFRINSTIQLNMLVQERLKDITRIIEQKNPTLLKEIRKGTGTATQSAVGQKIDIHNN